MPGGEAADDDDAVDAHGVLPLTARTTKDAGGGDNPRRSWRQSRRRRSAAADARLGAPWRWSRRRGSAAVDAQCGSGRTSRRFLAAVLPEAQRGSGRVVRQWTHSAAVDAHFGAPGRWSRRRRSAAVDARCGSGRTPRRFLAAVRPEAQRGSGRAVRQWTHTSALPGGGPSGGAARQWTRSAAVDAQCGSGRTPRHFLAAVRPEAQRGSGRAVRQWTHSAAVDAPLGVSRRRSGRRRSAAVGTQCGCERTPRRFLTTVLPEARRGSGRAVRLWAHSAAVDAHLDASWRRSRRGHSAAMSTQCRRERAPRCFPAATLPEAQGDGGRAGGAAICTSGGRMTLLFNISNTTSVLRGTVCVVYIISPASRPSFPSPPRFRGAASAEPCEAGSSAKAKVDDGTFMGQGPSTASFFTKTAGVLPQLPQGGRSSSTALWETLEGARMLHVVYPSDPRPFPGLYRSVFLVARRPARPGDCSVHLVVANTRSRGSLQVPRGTVAQDAV
jgi:hypothetical protein